MASFRTRIGRFVAAVRRRLASMRQTSDPSSGLRMAKLGVEMVRPDLAQPVAQTAVPLRVKDLEGDPVRLRPRSRDGNAFDMVFQEGLHLPPPEIDGPLGRIAVFGANIGLPLADLGMRYPSARLLGVEPDAENAVLARANVAPLGDRCTIVEAAVWWEDATLTVSWTHDAWGFDLAEAAEPGTPTEVIEAVAAQRLLDGFAGGKPVDYLLVNIESAWHELLSHGEWTRDVRCIKIEVQTRYDDAVPLLERLGYTARMERLGWGAFAIGVKEVA
ncbi:hypothetical protein [Pseudonocardia sp. TRM90224]|uniref:hypothetical protein n=1 Tax=Pseudonocardia sp. TRM90224 TaxID=2812678 RepID=UPI001E5778A3|nr:hypothetical protein [Pseudonocardia sp. TRM90224]